MLIKALQYEEIVEHLRTLLTYKAVSLVDGDEVQFNDFNKIVAQYNEFRDPSKIKDRDESVVSVKQQLDALTNLDLSKIKVKSSGKKKPDLNATDIRKII